MKTRRRRWAVLGALPLLASVLTACVPGSLAVSSTPSGARVFLDGADTGRRTPATIAGVAPGGHVLRLTLDGHGDALRSVVVAPGQAVAVDVSLSPVPDGGGRYDVGNPTVEDVWVDPARGDDARSGADRSTALRTLGAAWARIPPEAFRTGYRIQLVGTAPYGSMPDNWFSDRRGSHEFPIMVNAADGPGTATIRGGMNVNGVRYLYVIGVGLEAGGAAGAFDNNVFHGEGLDHLLLRQTRVAGLDDSFQEVVKVNQSQHVYVEDSEITRSFQTAVDFFAVQHGHLVGNRIHRAGDWCAYFKGGSAYLRVDGNELWDCTTGGFSAGEGSAFDLMVSPWLHYEVYDVKFVNNVVHDTDGAGMGVNGGYDVLLAHNTLYRVGARSHVLEFVHGARVCLASVPACRSRLDSGGWGTATPGAGGQWIPNRNVYVYNNLVYNPSGYQSQWAHLSVHGPAEPPAGSSVPTPSRADDNLRVQGNLVWNGPPDLPLGVGEPDTGCAPSNPTCNETQLRSDNAVNATEPELVDPAGGNFRPAPGGNVFAVAGRPIPAFAWDDAPLRPDVRSVPGDLSNDVPRNRAGEPHSNPPHPGAY